MKWDKPVEYTGARLPSNMKCPKNPLSAWSTRARVLNRFIAFPYLLLFRFSEGRIDSQTAKEIEFQQEFKMADHDRLDPEGNVIKTSRKARKVPAWRKRRRNRKKNEQVPSPSPPPPSSASEVASEGEEDVPTHVEDVPTHVASEEEDDVPTHVGVNVPAVQSDSESGGGDDEGDAVSLSGL
jgi:hypothetical protein